MIFDGKHEIPLHGSTFQAVLERIVELVPVREDLADKTLLLSEAEEAVFNKHLSGMMWPVYFGRLLDESYGQTEGLEGIKFSGQLTFPKGGGFLLTIKR